jgi:hypothetical protein
LNGSSRDDGCHFHDRRIHMAVGEHGDGAIMIRTVAVMMQSVMEVGTGNQCQESQYLQNKERGQNHFGSLAETQTLPPFQIRSHDGTAKVSHSRWRRKWDKCISSTCQSGVSNWVAGRILTRSAGFSPPPYDATIQPCNRSTLCLLSLKPASCDIQNPLINIGSNHFRVTFFSKLSKFKIPILPL